MTAGTASAARCGGKITSTYRTGKT